jgi:flavodoxin
MNILIAYYSESGNTEKIAKSIHAEVLAQGHKSVLMHTNDLAIEELKRYDLIFLGSACHDSDLAVPIKEVLERIAPSPPFSLAGFVTHAATMPEGGEWQQKMYDQWAGRCVKSFERVCQEKEITWCGYFNCQGAPTPPIEDFIHQEIITDENAWLDYLAQIKGRPNEKDLEKAKKFTQSVLRT